MMQEGKIFFVYIDRTLEEVPRIFYVGKGLKARISSKKRNKYWCRIANKYGSSREIILATKDEKYAHETEIRLIYENKTFEPAWPKGIGFGSNLTIGGEGTAGRSGKLSAKFGKPTSEETKRKIGKANSGENGTWYGKRGDGTAFYGRTHTNETKKKISITSSGKNNPMYGMSGELAPAFGRKHTEEEKNKALKSRLQLIYSNKKNKASILKPYQILEIHKKYATGKFTQKEIGMQYGVTRECIGRIITGKTWRHLPINIIKNKEEFLENKKKRVTNKGENSSQAILTEVKVLEIRKKFLTGEYSQMGLAKEYSISRGCVRHIISGKSWSHLPINGVLQCIV